MIQIPQPKHKPLTLDDFFLLRRRPKLKMSDLWEKPEDTQVYQELLEKDDFLTLHFDPANKQKYPVVVQDLENLDQHLLATFFEYSQRAKYYQNLFYRYQWVFIFGTFLTMALGVISTFNFTTPTELDNSVGFKVLSIFITAISAAIAYFTAASNRKQPQRLWARNRRLAEELRMLYFLYLSHLPPFHEADRLDVLRKRVAEIENSEDREENNG